MNRFSRIKVGLSVAALVLLTACVDDNYDLSDIDTTVKVDVNNLTVPVNIDAVTLRSIIDLEEDGTVQEVNGEYAVLQKGTFKSDNIHIDDFTISSPSIDPVHVNIPDPGNGRFPVATPESPFSTDARNISEFIHGIDYVTTEATITLSNSIKGVSGSDAILSNAVYELPKGLTVTSADGTYDSATGLFTLSGAVPLSHEITIRINAIDFNKAGARFDAANHSLHYSSAFAIKSGEITLSGAKHSSIDFTANFHLSAIKAITIDGVIEYDITDLDVTDVQLNNLPDVLADENTDITLNNPQIFLAIFNPLNDKDVYASSGMTITAYRNGVANRSFSPEPNLFRTGTDSRDGYYNFCMAPRKGDFEGYANPTFVPFPSLSEVLSGNGLPTSLSIALDSPKFPLQHVKGIRLGSDLGMADGHYTFYAPLAFGAGSRVVYTDHLDGWSSEDLDHVTISELNVHATVSTDIPIDLDFTGFPIDKNGNQINGVRIEGGKIPANAKNHELNLRITGQIRGLDGIRFSAVATASGDEKALQPGMSIDLSNVRPTVTGYYEKEL